MVEGFFKLLEHSSVLDQLSLHLWCDLLIEWELFNDQIEIVFESLLNVLSDVVIESWLDMEWLVWFLNFLNPHV
jgi:hypothetical protein